MSNKNKESDGGDMWGENQFSFSDSEQECFVEWRCEFTGAFSDNLAVVKALALAYHVATDEFDKSLGLDKINEMSMESWRDARIKSVKHSTSLWREYRRAYRLAGFSDSDFRRAISTHAHRNGKKNRS